MAAALDKSTPLISKGVFATLEGQRVRGLVVATKRPEQPRVATFVSLHGLSTTGGVSSTYLVVASKASCEDGNVDGADFLVWRTPIPANPDGGLHVSSARLRAPLHSARSVRVYDRTQVGQPTQLACAKPTRWPRSPAASRP